MLPKKAASLPRAKPHITSNLTRQVCEALQRDNDISLFDPDERYLFHDISYFSAELPH